MNKHSYIYRILLVAIWTLLFSFGNLQAAESHPTDSTHTVAAETKGFNAADMIFEHLGDSYSWHIASVGETHISIPLPVIVYSAERGWNCFMSTKFHHGHDAYQGFYIAHQGAYKDKIVETNSAGEQVRPIDLSITKNVLSLFITVGLMLGIFLSMSRYYRLHPRRAPRGFYALLEPLIVGIYDEAIKPGVGKKADQFAPYLLTVFFFIFISNLMGLVPVFPGGANLTGNLAITMVLAVVTFFVVNIYGSKHYWLEIFWGEVPTWLKAPIPLMPIIEIFGALTKPIALMIRLFANILAGHMIIMVLMSMIFIFGTISVAAGAGISIISVLFTIFMSFLEILVAFIQAYVFTMLSAIFIGMSTSEPDHAEH